VVWTAPERVCTSCLVTTHLIRGIPAFATDSHALAAVKGGIVAARRRAAAMRPPVKFDNMRRRRRDDGDERRRHMATPLHAASPSQTTSATTARPESDSVPAPTGPSCRGRAASNARASGASSRDDRSDLEFRGAAGIRCSFEPSALGTRGRLIPYDPSPMVARIINITGLDQLVDVLVSRVITAPHAAGTDGTGHDSADRTVTVGAVAGPDAAWMGRFGYVMAPAMMSSAMVSSS
jgi:hypothetical protein